jgi:hypothetical protein
VCANSCAKRHVISLSALALTSEVTAAFTSNTNCTSLVSGMCPLDRFHVPLTRGRPLPVIFRNSKFFVRHERDLGVSDQTPAFGQIDDPIGQSPGETPGIVSSMSV